jgi:hypothetical protein
MNSKTATTMRIVKNSAMKNTIANQSSCVLPRTTKKMSLHLSYAKKAFLLLLLTGMSFIGFSQTAILFTVTNFVQTAPNAFRYDVMMTNTGTTAISVRGHSWGLNTATGIANGGVISQTYISRDPSIDASGVPVPSLPVATAINTGVCATSYHLRFATTNASGNGAPLVAGVPIRLGTVQVQTSATSFPSNFNPFTQCSTFTPIQVNALAGKTACVATCFITPPGASSAISATTGLSATMIPNPAGASPFKLNPLAVCVPVITNVTASACDSYTWAAPIGNGNTYTATGTYYKTTAQTANPTCYDTTYLNLTINNSSTSSTSQTVCDSYTWPANGETYTESGIYTVTTLNADGCVNTASLSLTVNNNSASTSADTACDSYTWPANGLTYTASGAYTATSLNIAGCVNTEMLQLTLNAATSNAAVTACDSYVWVVDGQTYTTSGNYTYTNLNTYGCVQINNLALTVNASTSSSQNATACDSLTWPTSGLTYTSSGTYTATTLNAEGCVSSQVLTLVINNSTYTTNNAAACNTYTWSETGQTYTQSGLYSYSTLNAQGCAWQHYLNLVINTITSVTQSQSACSSYTWPVTGLSYTATGVYQGSSVNAAGCNQTNQLNLTINSSSSSTQTITANGSYTWAVNGQTYTASGTYTASTINSIGCTQYNTLVLSMNTTAAPAVLYTINNMVQTAAGMFAFDIWLTNTGNVTLNAKNLSFGLNTSANIGTLGLTYVNGSKDAIFNSISTYNPATTLKGSAPNTYYHLRMTSSQATAGTEPALQPNATYKIGRFVVSSSQNWTAMLNPFLPPGVAPVQVSTLAGSTQCVLYTLINGSSTAYSLFGTTNAPTAYNLNVLSAAITPSPTGSYPFLLGAGCNNTSSTVAASACNTYTWGVSGLTYTNSGVYTSIQPIGAGPCYSVDSLLLTIHPSTTGTQSATACESYLWSCNSQTYSLSGVYTCTFTNPSGCLHTQTLNLVVNHDPTIVSSINACDTYTWTSNGQTYTTSGTYIHTSLNAAGCAETETLNLTIQHSTSGITSATACDSYVWGGALGNAATYTSSNTTDTYTTLNAAGCVHTQYLNLMVNYSSATGNATEIVCDTYNWNGVTYTSSGAYTYTSINAVGCINTATLNLTVNNSTTDGDATITACDAYSSNTWNGMTYTTSGMYTYTTINAAGCLNTATLNLTVNYSSANGDASQIACDSYLWNGTSYTTSGVYTYTSINAANCINTATLNVVINNSTTGSLSVTACDTYTWEGTTYTNSGVYTKTFTNAAGCDSVLTMHVTINYSAADGGSSQTVCDAYTWNGTTYTTSGMYTYTTINAVGCINTATLNLTVNYSSTNGDASQTACDSYLWNGTSYTTTGVYTYTSINAANCINTAILNVVINNSTTGSLSVTACDTYTWEGTTYTNSGAYTKTFTNAAGCDSLHTMHVTINYSTTDGGSSQTVCDAFTWIGTTYTTSGMYTYTSINAGGCLNTATLNLTVHYSSANGDAIQTACDAYTWNNATYTTSGTYTYTSINAANCINTATLSLTVNYSSTDGDTTITACDNYAWNGTAYTTSGTYTYTTLNASGCMNTATLYATIHYTTASATSVTACDSYAWIMTGQTYSNSGAYTHTSLNADGCLHTSTLNLQVGYAVNTSLSVTACDTYTWAMNNQTYLSSGAYAHTTLTVDGCLNTTILHLTILYAGTDSLQTTQCSYFFWPASGQTYIQSGVYTAASINAQGCVMNHYLQLTIQAATSSDCMLSSMRKSIPYQAAIRNGAGEPIVNQNVKVRFTIYDSLPGANPLYQEYHDCTTSSLGLLSLNVGMGVPVIGSYFAISWSDNPTFLKVEVDTTNTGNTYTNLGTQQLASVPYAHYSETSGNGLQQGNSEGEMMYWDGAAWVTIPPGAQGQTLTFCNGKPHWGPCP